MKRHDLVVYVSGGKFSRYYIDGKRVSRGDYALLRRRADRRGTDHVSHAGKAGPHAHGTTRWRHSLTVYV